MTWGFVGAAAIGAATTIATSDKGGGDVGFADVPESNEVKAARKKLFSLAAGEPPDVPLRKIAPLEPPGEERELARATAKELAEPQDILSLPEVQGIIQEARVTGDLLTNRLGRSLQASGNITSTSGRDILGRAVTDIQKSLTASLAPFASEERARRKALIPVLEGLGLTEEDRRRLFEQAGLSAEFEKIFAESKQLETFTIPLLQSIIGNQPAAVPFIQGQQPSTFSQLSPLIGPLLTAVLQSGGSDGAGMTPGTAPGVQGPTISR